MSSSTIHGEEISSYTIKWKFTVGIFCYLGHFHSENVIKSVQFKRHHYRKNCEDEDPSPKLQQQTHIEKGNAIVNYFYNN